MNHCTNCGNRMEIETKTNNNGDDMARMACTDEDCETVSPWGIEKAKEVKDLEALLTSEHNNGQHKERTDNCPLCWAPDSPFEKGESDGT